MKIELWQHHESGLIMFIAPGETPVGDMIKAAERIEPLKSSPFEWVYEGKQEWDDEFMHFLKQHARLSFDTEFAVGVSNGQGTLASNIYSVSKPFATGEDAKAAADIWAAENPERNGWNAHVGVVVWNAERREWEWAQ